MPGFIEGIRALKASQGVTDYDVNARATRQEMRAYVCGQCHVEYYFKGPEKRLVYPWAKGLKVDDILQYYEEIRPGSTRRRKRRAFSASRSTARARDSSRCVLADSAGGGSPTPPPPLDAPNGPHSGPAAEKPAAGLVPQKRNRYLSST